MKGEGTGRGSENTETQPLADTQPSPTHATSASSRNSSRSSNRASATTTREDLSERGDNRSFSSTNSSRSGSSSSNGSGSNSSDRSSGGSSGRGNGSGSGEVMSTTQQQLHRQPMRFVRSSGPGGGARQYLLLSVEVGGKGPFDFVVDTGSSATLVRPSLAFGTLGADREACAVSRGMGGVGPGGQEGRDVTLTDVTIGPFRLGAVQVGGEVTHWLQAVAQSSSSLAATALILRAREQCR